MQNQSNRSDPQLNMREKKKKESHVNKKCPLQLSLSSSCCSSTSSGSNFWGSWGAGFSPRVLYSKPRSGRQPELVTISLWGDHGGKEPHISSWYNNNIKTSLKSQDQKQHLSGIYWQNLNLIRLTVVVFIVGLLHWLVLLYRRRNHSHFNLIYLPNQGASWIYTAR